MKDDVKAKIPNGTPKALIPYDAVLNKDGVSKLGSNLQGDHCTFLGLNRKTDLTKFNLEMLICK
jgi:hypothetical protein